ncbi:MAG: phosphoribosylanthranilate isomerase [Aquificaceae bacterium]|nr:phosphoribosylanthranilate isomerase [Aquificaceae bacterium]MDW8095895.1 phosphoribosylanthranilate isomerase [Aquificaceae bacterium]
MVRIKLCGFTRSVDIKRAVELGVDYVGIILYPKSPRYVDWQRVEELLEAGVGSKRVAVMVNPKLEDVERALRAGFDLIQLHGEEDFSLAESVGVQRVIKAFRTCPDLKLSEEWKRVYSILLDACSELYGGSGKHSNWKMARDLVDRGFRVFLAGGLTPEKVQEAIREVKPYCVDASSGIEISPGVKDHKKMEEFVHAVKNALKH